MIKVAVIGSRDFNDYDKLKIVLDKFKSKIGVIISGGARGADTLAEKYADENEIEKLIFPADWSKGRGAGFERNKKIIENADIVIAFWDGKSRGTSHSIGLAKRKGIVTIIIDA